MRGTRRCRCREAGKYHEKLQHDWEDLSNSVTNLRGRKERFFQQQLDELNAKAATANENLAHLQLQEESLVSALRTGAISKQKFGGVDCVWQYFTAEPDTTYIVDA